MLYPFILSTMYRLMFLFAFLLSPSLIFAGVSTELENRVVKDTLSNGIRILILERHKVPVVSFVTWVDVGSVNERKGITGVVHLLGSMAYKGTYTDDKEGIDSELKAIEEADSTFSAWLCEYRKREFADSIKLDSLGKQHRKAVEELEKYIGDNELRRTIEKNGGRGLRVVTNPDATVGFCNLPSNKVELWMAIESNRFLNPVFRGFYFEKRAVMRERIQEVERDPFGKLWEELFTTAFKAHPYGNPVIGYMSDLITLEKEEAQDFFMENYVPRNLVLCIVGDVASEQVIEMAEKYWGRIPENARGEMLVEAEEPPQRGQKRVEVEDKAQPIVMIGYHCPSIYHKDAAVFDVIEEILGEGKDSRIYKSLVLDEKIAVYAGGASGSSLGKYPGLYIFFAIPAQGHTAEECEKTIYREIHKLKSEQVGAEEMSVFKSRLKVNFLKKFEKNETLAYQLALYETFFEDYREFFRREKKIEEVSPKDVRRVVKKYFKKKYRTVAEIVPPGDDTN